MVMQYSFKINGIEIGPTDGSSTSYILDGTKIELTRDNIQGNFARIYLSNTIDSVLTLQSGQTIEITRGEDDYTLSKIFLGNVKQIEIKDDIYILTCADKLQQLKYKLFTKSYDKDDDPEAGEVSEIFKDVVENGGFSVSSESSGTGTTDIVLDKFRNRNDKRLDRLNVLSQVIDWIFYYDYNNDWVRFEPKGFVEYSNALIVGTNVFNIPRWEENIENMRNNLTIEGASQIDTKIETFTASSDTEFTLSYSPISIESKLDGVLKVLGVDGASTTYDYTLDVDKKVITFTSPITGSLVVTYTANVPTPVSGKNVDSIAEFGLEQEDLFFFDDIVTVQDAESRLSQLLAILGTSEKSTMLNTNEWDINIGNKISYANPLDSSRDGEYVVSSKVINFGQNFDIIKIGTPRVDINKIFMSFDERLKYLEGSSTDVTGVLRTLFQLFRTITYGPRYFKKQTRDVSNDLLYDTDRYYDTGLTYQDTGYTNSLVDHSVVQGKDTYKELFYDTDFYDSINSSNVTWDTSGNKISFLANGIAQTNPIFKDGTNTEIIKTLLYIFTNTGDIDYYASADGGSNWELLSSSPHTFTNTGSELLLKAVESSGAVADITYMEAKYGK